MILLRVRPTCKNEILHPNKKFHSLSEGKAKSHLSMESHIQPETETKWDFIVQSELSHCS